MDGENGTINELTFGGSQVVETSEKRGRGRPSKGGNNGNTNSTTTEGRGGGTEGRNTETGEISNTESLGLPVLNIPIPPPKEKSTRGRKPKSSDKEFDKTLEGNVSMLLQSGFAFASNHFGEHWSISDEESKTISEPLTRILQRLGVNESLNKYADYAMLLTGISLVVVPRVLIQKAQRGVKENGRKETKVVAINSKSNGQPDTAPTNISQTNFKASLDVGY